MRRAAMLLLLPRLAIPALALLVGTAVQAMTLRELHTLETQDKKNGKAYASYYLVGVMEGLREAGSVAQRNGQKPAFCVEGRRLEPSMARSLFQTELTRHVDIYEADMPVQLVMANALANTYRCTQ